MLNFARLHACWIVFDSVQGEKGEPGMVIGADGSALSTLAGPPGPKGVKVMIVALLSPSLSLKVTPHAWSFLCLFPG